MVGPACPPETPCVIDDATFDAAFGGGRATPSCSPGESASGRGDTRAMRAASLLTILSGALAVAGLGCSGGCTDGVPFTVPAPSTVGDVVDQGDCWKLCETDAGAPDPETRVVGCELTSDASGARLLSCSTRHCITAGRATRGVSPGKIQETDPVADHLALSAALEASSVESFRRLRNELRAHRAPRALLRAASRAEHDERRHARRMTRHAARFGAPAPTPGDAAPLEPRSIEEIAVENAVEGCVSETYGALLALWQATNAVDAGLRSSLRRIAVDETRHAALAWTLAGWLEGRLDRAARERVRAARALAITDLRDRLGVPHPALVAQGLAPRSQEARLLFDHLAGSLLEQGPRRGSRRSPSRALPASRR